MSKILIVDDEEKLRNELKYFLENNGYEVILITDFNDTLNEIVASKADLILLDIGLPYLDGETICKNLRKKITTPIIMVTSKNTPLDEIISINYGADDFITKPYNTGVLLARIDRLLKRVSNSTIIYYDLTIDFEAGHITKGNMTEELTRNENKILKYLLTYRGKIVDRNDLMDYLWNDNEFIDDNTLTVNINRLRIKLENLGYKDIIKTKRGQGYIIL